MIIAPNGDIIQEANFMKEESLSCELSDRKIRATRIATPIFKNENLDITMREIERIIKGKN